MKNDGKSAEAAFLARLDKPGVVVERFWDQRDLRGINNGRPVGDFPKPADFLVTENGLMHYAEVKSNENPTRFSFGDIRPKQRSTALKQAAVGGPYWFYIFSYALGQWFRMGAEQFAAAVTAGQKSIKYEELTPW